MPGINHIDGDTPKGESRATSEQARAATHVPLTEEQIQAAQVGKLAPLAGPIHIADYDHEWPRLFEREAERIRAALGDRVLLLEHVGSTSVPGLAAKPKIDMLLVVADSADELAYVPALEAAGYVLQIREPDWYQHRMFFFPVLSRDLDPVQDEINDLFREMYMERFVGQEQANIQWAD